LAQKPSYEIFVFGGNPDQIFQKTQKTLKIAKSRPPISQNRKNSILIKNRQNRSRRSKIDPEGQKSRFPGNLKNHEISKNLKNRQNRLLAQKPSYERFVFGGNPDQIFQKTSKTLKIAKSRPPISQNRKNSILIKNRQNRSRRSKIDLRGSKSTIFCPENAQKHGQTGLRYHPPGSKSTPGVKNRSLEVKNRPPGSKIHQNPPKLDPGRGQTGLRFLPGGLKSTSDRVKIDILGSKIDHGGIRNCQNPRPIRSRDVRNRQIGLERVENRQNPFS
jgi:hypothetical protein